MRMSSERVCGLTSVQATLLPSATESPVHSFHLPCSLRQLSKKFSPPTEINVKAVRATVAAVTTSCGFAPRTFDTPDTKFSIFLVHTWKCSSFPWNIGGFPKSFGSVAKCSADDSSEHSFTAAKLAQQRGWFQRQPAKWVVGTERVEDESASSLIVSKQRVSPFYRDLHQTSSTERINSTLKMMRRTGCTIKCEKNNPQKMRDKHFVKLGMFMSSTF